jgi:hypothetical protein
MVRRHTSRSRKMQVDTSKNEMNKRFRAPDHMIIANNNTSAAGGGRGFGAGPARYPCLRRYRRAESGRP